MLIAAVFFFLLAGFVGIFLLRSILRNEPTQKPVALIHGSIAGIGLLILLTYVALGHHSTLILTCLGLFILTALGGITLFLFDVTGKPIPKGLAIGHPILAAASIVTFIVYIVKLF